jgi:hypothetical protein
MRLLGGCVRHSKAYTLGQSVVCLQNRENISFVKDERRRASPPTLRCDGDAASNAYVVNLLYDTSAA